MADLQEAANQFIENLIAQNVTGLMGTFTPAAMQKAMSMGQGPQPQGPVTQKEAKLLPAEGDDHPVDLVVGTDEQQAIIGTVWRELDGEWKITDIAVKQQP